MKIDKIKNISIQLHGFIEIFLDIEILISKIKRTDREDEIKKFIGKKIRFKNDLIVYESDFMDFIELLDCFTKNLLETKTKYELSYKKGGGYTAIISSQNKKLSLQTTTENEEVFLSKYDCKVITSNFNKIYSKCIRSELV